MEGVLSQLPAETGSGGEEPPVVVVAMPSDMSEVTLPESLSPKGKPPIDITETKY